MSLAGTLEAPVSVEMFTAEAVFAHTIPLATELSILQSGASERRTEFYDKLGVVHTPLETASAELHCLATPRADLLLVKPELTQAVGSYKIRGAAAAVAARLREKPDLMTLETASAGNHAQGVAQAAARAGIGRVIAHTFTGITAPKETALCDLGVEVYKHPDLEEAAEVAQAADGRPNSAYIPPFDSYEVMAGQSTIASEVFLDLITRAAAGELDLHRDEIHFVLPGGGGGCASGNAVLVRLLKDMGVVGENVHVWVAQGEGADAIHQERQGAQLTAANPWYDGARVTTPGKRNMAILADDRFVRGAMIVSEGKTGMAMHWLGQHHGRAVEPTGALSLAGAMQLDESLPAPTGEQRRIFVTVTSGGNVSPETTQHFMAAASAENRAAFAQLSQDYLERPVYGLAELLCNATQRRETAWTAGSTAASKLCSGTRVASGFQFH